MSTIEIHLPPELERYLQDRVIWDGYKDVSALVIDLLDADRYRKTRQEVEAMLLETIDGPFKPWTDQDVEDIRTEGTRLLARRKARN